MEILGISVWGMLFALLLLAVPAYFFWRVSPRMLVRLAIAVGRALLQLAFVGLYMHWLFRWNSVAIDMLWLLLMAVIGSFAACSRNRLQPRLMVFPIVVGLLVSVVAVGLYLLLLVFNPVQPFTARWIVPVAGLLLCGGQMACSSGLNAYYKYLRSEGRLYDFLLGNGATHLEAVMPFLRKAVEESFSPLLANMAVLGIVTLPELTLGQMLSGEKPTVAVVLTAVMIVASLSVSVLSLVIALYVADLRTFDAYGRLRHVWKKD